MLIGSCSKELLTWPPGSNLLDPSGKGLGVGVTCRTSQCDHGRGAFLLLEYQPLPDVCLWSTAFNPSGSCSSLYSGESCGLVPSKEVGDSLFSTSFQEAEGRLSGRPWLFRLCHIKNPSSRRRGQPWRSLESGEPTLQAHSTSW